MNNCLRPDHTFPCLLAVVLMAAGIGSLRAGERIVDGTLVPEEQFPTVGMAGSKESGDACTGTLIAPRFVLMAAHCVNNGSAGSIAFGQQEGVFVLGKKKFKTRHVFVHPTYANNDSQQKEGAIDLAIYELDQDVPKVTPSPLYRKTPAVGTVLTLAGYGLLGTGTAGTGEKTPPKGQIATGKTTIDIVTDTFIKWNFENVPAPGQESNTAPGDSGGPQFITENNILHVASVTSGGVAAKASFGDRSYNTRVDIAIPWIESITGGTPVADNHVPVISALESSAFGQLTGVPITFTVAAGDADNDVLQNHWIFGDGSEILNGDAAESHSFSKPGKFLVQLIVSDKKGGSAARDVSVGVLSSDPPSTPLTQATFVKKSFSADFSAKGKGSSIDVTIQSPELVYPDETAFAAAYPKTTFTELYVGNDKIASIFGTNKKLKNSIVKFDFKNGTLSVSSKGDKGLLAPALSLYGAANTDTKAAINVPISIELQFFREGQSHGARFGGTAAFMYAGKKNVSGKGK